MPGSPVRIQLALYQSRDGRHCRGMTENLMMRYRIIAGRLEQERAEKILEVLAAPVTELAAFWNSVHIQTVVSEGPWG